MFSHNVYLENPYAATEPEQGAAAPVEEVDRVESLQSQVDGVKNIMTQNVERILARGERLDDLMDISKGLQAGAQNFAHTSQKVARHYWWKNVKLIVVMIVIVAVVVLIIVLLATGVIPTSSQTPPVTTPKPPNSN
ncbi:Vesicle-associated membrane protein 8 [Bagarius yarrelli]|uniref:Vesicle-associated membrane protein 8 n=1 Tax=Bagarius yarrelli TaxID=175774 RepID=A0A556V0U6_BAGYA|nr:Vesicle-associated membrane protein 8 [Bagarius yarrelli]